MFLGCTGETKKGCENVVVYVQVNDKKLVLGTLSVEEHPQIMCDLRFEKDFVLSHNSSNTSVFVCGYKKKVPMFEYPLHRFNFVKSVYNNMKYFTL